jgi:hypothetical protein
MNMGVWTKPGVTPWESGSMSVITLGAHEMAEWPSIEIEPSTLCLTAGSLNALLISPVMAANHLTIDLVRKVTGDN